MQHNQKLTTQASKQIRRDTKLMHGTCNFHHDLHQELPTSTKQLNANKGNMNNCQMEGNQKLNTQASKQIGRDTKLMHDT